MALTQHRRRHLNGIKNWIDRVRLKPIPIQKIQAAAKEVPWAKWNTYLNRLETRVNEILSSGNWPTVTDESGRVATRPHEIHDFLEKRTPEFKE